MNAEELLQKSAKAVVATAENTAAKMPLEKLKKRKRVETHLPVAVKKAKLEKRKPGALAADTVFLAAMANSAYTRKKEFKKQGVEKVLGQPLHDYELDDRHTNKTMTVWVNHKDKKVVTAFRGTQDLNDVAADAALFLGMEKMAPHFRQSLRNFENVADTYPGYKHTLTGHSLGGTTALYTAEHAGKIRESGRMEPSEKSQSIQKSIENFRPAALDIERRT